MLNKKYNFTDGYYFEGSVVGTEKFKKIIDTHLNNKNRTKYKLVGFFDINNAEDNVVADYLIESSVHRFRVSSAEYRKQTYFAVKNFNSSILSTTKTQAIKRVFENCNRLPTHIFIYNKDNYGKNR